jgi:hypothetical protein
MSYRNPDEKERTLMSQFKNLIGYVATGLAALSVAGAFVISDRIPEGHVGLKVGSFSQSYAGDLSPQGLSFNFLTSVKNLRAQQFPIDVKDLRPKDKDGILFEDMDLTVFIRLNVDNPQAVIGYIRGTGDINKMENGNYMVGLTNIAKEARAATLRTVHEFTSKQILDDKTVLENRATTEIQKELDTKYPGVFKVVDTNASSITYNAAVEASVQASATKDAQQKVMEIELAQNTQRKELLLAKFQTLKTVSQVTGVTIDQILMSNQIEAMADAGKYQMRGDPGKMAKQEIVIGPK